MAKKKQYSLRFKIWFGFFLVNLVLITAIVSALWQTKEMAATISDYINIDRPVIFKLLNIRENLNQSNHNLQALIIFHDARYADDSQKLWQERILPDISDLQKNPNLIRALELSDQSQTTLRMKLDKIKNLKLTQDQFLKIWAQQGSSQALLAPLKAISDQISGLNRDLSEAIKDQETAINQQVYSLQQGLEQLLYAGLILLTIGLFLSLTFVLIIGNSITKPIREMTLFMRNLARGNLNHELELSASKEFEELSRTLNLVVRSLNDLAIVSNNIAMGDHSHKVMVKSEEDTLAIAVNRMLGNFDKIVEQAYAIAEGNFSSEIKPRSANDKLGQALAHMTKTLRINRKVNEEQHWLQEGLNQLATLLSETNEVNSIAHITLNTLCHYLNAGMGVIYIYEPHTQVLKFTGGFATDSKQLLEGSYPLGHGLIGQVGAERKVMLIKDLPSLKKMKTPQIETATAQLDSVGLYIAPLLYEKNLIGVIEINFYKPIREVDIRLLAESATLIAGHLRSAQQQALSNNLIKEVGKASQYKSEFLANMSHELRTPLNSLIVLTKLLLNNSESNLNTDQLGSLRIIHASAEDLLYLINDILDLSKVEAGKLEIQWGDVELSRLNEILNSQFFQLTQEKGVGFSLEMQSDIAQTIVSDEHRLLQILRNLLSNAIKFTREGSVKLRIKKADKFFKFNELNLNRNNTLVFEVQDSGIGISPSQQKFIFEPFRQADGSTSRKYGGTGLGLSISLKLAKLLGGFIDVESVEGQGSTFRLYLPFDPTQTSSSETLALSQISDPHSKVTRISVESSPTPNLKGKWSIIDDIPDLALNAFHIIIVSTHLKESYSFANLLEKHGARVEKVANIAQLEKCLAPKKEFSVWFSDGSLSFDPGYRDRILSEQPHAKMIFWGKESDWVLQAGKSYTLLLSEDGKINLSSLTQHLIESSHESS